MDHQAKLRHLGLDHQRRTTRHTGRGFRLTDGQGYVVKEVLA